MHSPRLPIHPAFILYYKLFKMLNSYTFSLPHTHSIASDHAGSFRGVGWYGMCGLQGFPPKVKTEWYICMRRVGLTATLSTVLSLFCPGATGWSTHPICFVNTHAPSYHWHTAAPRSVHRNRRLYTAELDVYSMRRHQHPFAFSHNIHFSLGNALLSRWDYFCFYSYDWFFFVTVYLWGAGVLNYYQPLKFRFNINWSVGKSLIFLVQCFLYRMQS